MNILNVFVLAVILLKCVTASVDAFGVEFKGAVKREDFEWFEANWESWRERRDLLDDVISKGC